MKKFTSVESIQMQSSAGMGSLYYYSASRQTESQYELILEDLHFGQDIVCGLGS